MESMPTATASRLAVLAALGLGLTGCGQSGSSDDHSHGADTHTHADGTTHSDHAVDSHMNEGHTHEEIALAPATIGDITIELAQSHGAIKAGQEGHLVVKLPYKDNGATIVRAWIGTEDRTLSFVGRGEYAASHDDYDIHAMAPDPLPANTRWWIEIESPDGTKVVGSATPILD